jgi:hypothetical protein
MLKLVLPEVKQEPERARQCSICGGKEISVHQTSLKNFLLPMPRKRSLFIGSDYILSSQVNAPEPAYDMKQREQTSKI